MPEQDREPEQEAQPVEFTLCYGRVAARPSRVWRYVAALLGLLLVPLGMAVFVSWGLRNTTWEETRYADFPPHIWAALYIHEADGVWQGLALFSAALCAFLAAVALHCDWKHKKTVVRVYVSPIVLLFLCDMISRVILAGASPLIIHAPQTSSGVQFYIYNWMPSADRLFVYGPHMLFAAVAFYVWRRNRTPGVGAVAHG